MQIVRQSECRSRPHFQCHLFKNDTQTRYSAGGRHVQPANYWFGFTRSARTVIREDRTVTMVGAKVKAAVIQSVALGPVVLPIDHGAM